MDQPTLDMLSKVAIPLVTFIAGVFVTLATKRTDRRKDELRAHVRGVLKITNDWYNQVHTIVVNGSIDGETIETSRQAFFYVQNRLLMPELLLHLNYIKQVDPRSLLIAPTEAFLSEVTNYKQIAATSNAENKKQSYVCHLIPAMNEQMNRTRHKKNLLLLKRLDACLQELSRVTAIKLARDD